jgi:ATP-dependent RNA helicase DeaD
LKQNTIIPKDSSQSFFTEISLSKETLKSIDEMGYNEATPIQKLSIPSLLNGDDLIGQAQTGTGKTAAFGIPLVEKISPKDKTVSGIILCPTRELAIQVSVELGKLSRHKKHIHILAVFGGDPIQKQIQALRRGTVNIVVGTPGRIMDLYERKVLNLDSIKIAVLDEADEMLNMGFRDEIEELLSWMPDTRQTVLFSATMPKPIMDIANRFLHNPTHAKITRSELTAANIQQFYYETRESEKTNLIQLLKMYYDLKTILIFCNTKRKVDDVVKSLAYLGISANSLHGDLNQNQRNQVLDAFRKGTNSVLVATDVAARGINVNEIDGVFNYDLPMDFESYVHRIGRTGRAGKSGIAFSFVSSNGEVKKLYRIEKNINAPIEKKKPPGIKDMKEAYVKQVENMYHAHSKAKDISFYKTVLEKLDANGITAEEIAPILLSMNFPFHFKEGR